MILKIVQAGDPALRQKARRLSADEIKSPAIQDLIERMRDTMYDAPGVGLAAPQIGEPVQLIVIEDRPDYMQHMDPATIAQLERVSIPFQVLANPHIVLDETRSVTYFEGCLSMGGFTGLVRRAASVHVEAMNEHGEPVSIDARGWYARILQHEVDHLRGVMCTDRMHTRSLMTQQNHARHWAGLSVDEVMLALEIEHTG
jgi:peptide deformylase